MPFEYPKPKPKSPLKRWLERREAYWKLRRWFDRRRKRNT